MAKWRTHRTGEQMPQHAGEAARPAVPEAAVPAATPEESEEFFRVEPAPPPYGHLYVVASVRVAGGRVVDGPRAITAADVFPGAAAKLERMVLAERHS